MDRLSLELTDRCRRRARPAAFTHAALVEALHGLDVEPCGEPPP